jgi:hypothetical protein
MRLWTHRFASLRAFAMLLLAFSTAISQTGADKFVDGCCINAAFARPRHVSKATIPKRRLLEALHCASSNRFMDGPLQLAQDMGDKRVLRVAYYFGTYLPQQEGDALTLVVYSSNGIEGWMFDMYWEGHNYYVANLPELRKAPKHWRVAEINGGMWSYTRLWYLAQEIGARPRQEIPTVEVIRSRPHGCDIAGPVWPTK